MNFVLDASAALSWCFADEACPASDALLQLVRSAEAIFVPAHWPAEMLSALLQGKRRGRIEDPEIQTVLADLLPLNILIAAPVPLDELGKLKSLADRYRLNAYDAVYLALALGEHLPLATNDDALIRACISCGVALL